MLKYSISIWAGSGMGGTEKCATLFACELKKRGNRVFYLAKEGPRSSILLENKIPLITATQPHQISKFFMDEGIDVVHQHVPGYPISNPLYEILQKLGPSRPKLIETNVFGRMEDPESLQMVDYRMFICRASGAQAFQRAKRIMSEKSLSRQTVVNYPILPLVPIEDFVRWEVRNQLCVGKDDLLGVRFGRPGNKWATWECEAFALARQKIKNLHLLLMEPSENIWRDVEAGRYGDGIILRRATTDFAWLEKLYGAADFSIHSSDWGESFGYTLAEAMASGLPVITMSTPWGDNAQVELIQNGKSGFVCRGPEEMSRRICDLTNPELRQKMGSLGKSRIGNLANLDKETDILEAVIISTLTGSESTLLKERRETLLAFAKDFHKRENDYSESRWVDPMASFHRLTYSLYRQARAAIRNRNKRLNIPTF